MCPIHRPTLAERCWVSSVLAKLAFPTRLNSRCTFERLFMWGSGLLPLHSVAMQPWQASLTHLSPIPTNKKTSGSVFMTPSAPFGWEWFRSCQNKLETTRHYASQEPIPIRHCHQCHHQFLFKLKLRKSCGWLIWIDMNAARKNRKKTRHLWPPGHGATCRWVGDRSDAAAAVPSDGAEPGGDRQELPGKKGHTKWRLMALPRVVFK